MSPEAAIQFHNKFFLKAPNLRAPVELMMALPNICVYVKDTQSRYVVTNDRHRGNYDHISQEILTGHKASDYFPALLAEAYEVNDRRVFEDGETIRNEMWLVPTIRGTPGWFLSNKSPLSNHQGEIIGLLGLMYPIATPEDQLTYFGELQRVLAYLETHFVDEISAIELAKIAGLSLPHFNRRFRKLLRLSPMEYVHSLRIQEAQRQLTTSTRSIGEISAGIGFYDQSHFTKRFKKSIGMTPLAYRSKFME